MRVLTRTRRLALALACLAVSLSERPSRTSTRERMASSLPPASLAQTTYAHSGTTAHTDTHPHLQAQALQGKKVIAVGRKGKNFYVRALYTLFLVSRLLCVYVCVGSDVRHTHARADGLGSGRAASRDAFRHVYVLFSLSCVYTSLW